MSKVIYSYKRTGQNGKDYKVNMIAGVVKDIREPASANAPLTITINAQIKPASGGDSKGDNWPEQEIRLTVWKDGIEKVQKMKLSVGSYVIATCGDIVEKEYNGYKSLNTSCWGIRYSTKWEIAEAKPAPLTVLTGRVDTVTEMGDGTAIVVLKVRCYDKGKGTSADVTHSVVLSKDLYDSKSKPAAKGNFTAIGKMTGDTTLKANRIDFAPYTPKKKD